MGKKLKFNGMKDKHKTRVKNMGKFVGKYGGTGLWGAATMTAGGAMAAKKHREKKKAQKANKM
jgi:hypothetical protein